MKLTDEYNEAGTPEQFYRDKGAQYRNPQERDVRAMLRRQLSPTELDHVLDLACGSGEATLEVVAMGGRTTCVDPFCGAACTERTGQECLPFSFESICHGECFFEPDSFSAVICSFALHLLDESYLPAILAVLASWSPVLIVLSPHKRPHIRPEWGWKIESEHVDNRVRFRRYVRS